MSVPEDVALARAIRALRLAMFLPLAGAFALGVLASAALLLTGSSDRLRLWPGLTAVLLGQLAALAAGAVVFAALQRALRPDADHREIRARTAGGLRRFPRPLVASLIVATAAWALVEPMAGLEALVGALVGAQAALPISLAARTLEA